MCILPNIIFCGLNKSNYLKQVQSNKRDIEIDKTFFEELLTFYYRYLNDYLNWTMASSNMTFFFSKIFVTISYLYRQ